MIDAAAIRTWARGHGIEVGERGKLPADLIAQYEAAMADDTPLDDDIPLGEPDLGSEAEAAPSLDKDQRERKPRRPRLAEKAKKMAERAGGKRVPVDGALQTGWVGIAMGLQRKPWLDDDTPNPNVPVGRMMMLQAPAAGVFADRAIAGTLPDRMLVQPLARGGAKGANLGMLIGPPLMVRLITTRPQLYEPLQPLLRQLVAGYLAEAGPELKRIRDREAKAIETLGELLGDELIDMDGHQVTIDDLVAGLFAPPEPVDRDTRVPEDV